MKKYFQTDAIKTGIGLLVGILLYKIISRILLK